MKSLPYCYVLQPTVTVPERFVVDARQIRVAGGGSLAEHPSGDSYTGGAARPIGADTGTTLGQGCFGKVTSMSYNDAPVAVKELSATTLDAASIGEWTARARALKLSCCS